MNNMLTSKRLARLLCALLAALALCGAACAQEADAALAPAAQEPAPTDAPANVAVPLGATPTPEAAANIAVNVHESAPTDEPTDEATAAPTVDPAAAPDAEPTAVPAADPTAMPEAAPASARSLLILYNTKTDDDTNPEGTVATLALLQPLLAHHLLTEPDGARRVLYFAADSQNVETHSTVIPLTDADSLDALALLLEDAQHPQNLARTINESGRADIMKYMVQDIEDALADLPAGRAADVWLINRASDVYEVTWNAEDGSFAGSNAVTRTHAAALTESLNMLLDLMQNYPLMTLHLVSGYTSPPKNKNADTLLFTDVLRQETAARGIDARRLTVHAMTLDGAREAALDALNLAWQLPTQALAPTDDGRYSASFTAGSGFTALRVAWPGKEEHDLRLTDSQGQPIAFSATPVLGDVWVIPQALKAGETVTLSAAAADTAMTPYVAGAQETYALTLTAVPDASVGADAARGGVTLQATLNAAEISQSAFTLTANLTAPDGQTAELIFKPEGTADGLHRWTASAKLDACGAYTLNANASLGVDASRDVGSALTLTVRNQPPSAKAPAADGCILPVGIPGQETLAWTANLADLFSDPDGDALTYTLPGGETNAAIEDGVLSVTAPVDAQDGESFDLTIESDDGNGATVRQTITLALQAFPARMADLRYATQDDIGDHVSANAVLTATYTPEGEALDWYASMQKLYPDLPALADALRVTLKQGEGEVTMNEDGSFTLTMDAPTASGKRKYAFDVYYGDQLLTGASVDGITQTIENSAPVLREDVAAELAAGRVFNDLRSGSVPLSELMAYKADLSAMFVDAESEDLTYKVALTGPASLRGMDIAADGVYTLAPGDEGYPMADILVNAPGKVVVILTASDGEKTAERTLTFGGSSLLLILILSAISVVALIAAIAIVLYGTRPTFRQMTLVVTQYGTSVKLPTGEQLWTDGLTLAQAAIMAGFAPGRTMTADALAAIRLKPVRGGCRVIVGKGVQASLQGAKGGRVAHGSACTVTMGHDALTFTFRR